MAQWRKFPNVAERVAFEQFVRNHATFILQCGGLNHYILRTLTGKPNIPGAEMTIDTDTKYLEINICYSEMDVARDWQDKDYFDLLRVLCHECTHIVTTEFVNALHIDNKANTISHHDERMTEHTSRWLLAAYVAFMESNHIDLKTGTINEK